MSKPAPQGNTPTKTIKLNFTSDELDLVLFALAELSRKSSAQETLFECDELTRKIKSKQ